MFLGLTYQEWFNSPLVGALVVFLIVLLKYESAKLNSALARLQSRNETQDAKESESGHDAGVS